MNKDRLIPKGVYMARVVDIESTNQFIKPSVKYPSFRWTFQIVGHTEYCGRYAKGLTPQYLFDRTTRDPYCRLTKWLDKMRGKLVKDHVIKRHTQLGNPVPVEALRKKYVDKLIYFKIRISHKRHKKGAKLVDYRVSSIVECLGPPQPAVCNGEPLAVRSSSID